MQFTDEQRDAIDISRLGENACIVAGPGSGKTTVLVERYRQLVAAGIQPSEILAITFTVKAATNMREKLAEKFAGDADMLSKLERANVSTIHGFCIRLLKEHATAAGIDPDVETLDEQRGALEQATALRETLDERFRERPASMRALLNATGGADLEQRIPAIYDALRAAGMRPLDLRGTFETQPVTTIGEILQAAQLYVDGFSGKLKANHKAAQDTAAEWMERVKSARGPRELIPLLVDKKAFNLLFRTNPAIQAIKQMREEAEILCGALLEELFAPERSLLIEILECFEARYRARKQQLASLDFNDLEYFAVRLLEENPDVRRQVNEEFRQVMIDEFQDTSEQQARLVELLHAPGRFYAVGDLNQSIYGFRHASPRVFRAHMQAVIEAGAHHRQLVNNWRSREAVLLATKTILNAAEGIADRELTPARQFAVRDYPHIEIIAVETGDEAAGYEREAEWVVSRIVDLREKLWITEDDEERPARLSDFSILVRNTGVLEAFLEALEMSGIAYNLNRRSGFFETVEARNLTHLLGMIVNPRDEVSTLAVLRSDFAGVSDEALVRLKPGREKFADTLMSSDLADFSDEDRGRLQRFRQSFAGWRADAAQTPAHRLLTRALDDVGYRWDPRTPTGANIEKFFGLARGYADMTLAELVEQLEAMRKADPREQDSPVDETLDAVQIMTTHAAKGLEFPVVILAGMDKGVDTSQASLNFTPRYGFGVKWSLDGDENTVPGLTHVLNKRLLDEGEKEEANRLLYVAMTRAQEHLIFSWSGKRHWAGTVRHALNVDESPADGPLTREYTAPNGRAFQVLLHATKQRPENAIGSQTTRRLPEALELQRPLLTGQFEPNTTATHLSLFASCPRKYYLSGYLGWSRDLVRGSGGPVVERSAAAIGTEVHKLLAGDPVPTPDWESMRLAQVFETSALGKRAFRARRREAEWDFVVSIEDLIVRGKVDLWFEDARGLTIVDYKTDDITREQSQSRALDYFGQIELYAVALERALGRKPAAAFLHFLRPDVTIAAPLANAGENISRIARDFAEAQERVEFPLHVGPHCRVCSFYRNLCPAKLLVGNPD